MVILKGVKVLNQMTIPSSNKIIDSPPINTNHL